MLFINDLFNTMVDRDRGLLVRVKVSFNDKFYIVRAILSYAQFKY